MFYFLKGDKEPDDPEADVLREYAEKFGELNAEAVRPCTSPVSPLYLPYISHVSPPYLPILASSAPRRSVSLGASVSLGSGLSPSKKW